MSSQTVAEWVVDGFLHPTQTLSSEFVDVDDFLRLPVAGIPDLVQFAVVRVRDEVVVVVQPPGERWSDVVQGALSERHPGARFVFVRSSSTGEVAVSADDFAEADACAVAVALFSCAWNDSATIRVHDHRRAFEVAVSYDGTSYLLSATTGGSR